MWTSTSMTFAESLVVSAMGLVTVMGVLALLAVSIILFSKIMAAGTAKKAPAAPVVQEPEGFLTEQEECAVILSVICEELQTSPENINITSIREIK